MVEILYSLLENILSPDSEEFFKFISTRSLFTSFTQTYLSLHLFVSVLLNKLDFTTQYTKYPSQLILKNTKIGDFSNAMTFFCRNSDAAGHKITRVKRKKVRRTMFGKENVLVLPYRYLVERNVEIDTGI
jgi:hypothetical protein